MESNQGEFLHTLLVDVAGATVTGSSEVLIQSLTLDSRRVLPGSLFVALRGTQTDGHAYINVAVNLGATAILCEELPEEINSGVT